MRRALDERPPPQRWPAARRRPLGALALAWALGCSGAAPDPNPAAEAPFEAKRGPPTGGPPAHRPGGVQGGQRPEAEPPARVTVLAPDPTAPGPQALAAALQGSIAPWTGRWPAPRPGEVWALWLAEGSPEALRGLLQPGPPRPDGLLVVLPPGAEDRQDWRPLAEVRVSVVDPVAALRQWGEAPPTPGPLLLAAAAAQAIGAHFELPVTPAAAALAAAALSEAELTAIDPGIRGALALGPTGEAPDPRARRGSPTALDPDISVRLAAAADPQLAPRLLADPEPLVRARALHRLREVDALQAALADPSSFVRVSAAQGLVELAHGGAHDAARPGLLQAAAHPDAYLRWKAAAGLGGDPHGLPALTAMLNDVDIDVRREAALSLKRAPEGALGRAEAAEGLRRAAQDPNTFVQRRAIEALPTFPGPETVTALEAALASPTALVGEAAARALAQLGRPVAPPRGYAPPSRPRSRGEAEAALASPDAVAQKDLCKLIEGEAWAAEVLAPLLASPDSELRKAAVGALGRSPAAGPALVAALADTDPDTVVTALVSLAALAHPDPAPVLPFLDHPDAELRLRATEALAAAIQAMKATGAPPSSEAQAAVARMSRDPDERIAAAAAPLDPTVSPAEVSSVLGRRALAAVGRIDPAEAQLLVRAAAPGAPAGLRRWGEAVIDAEDYLLHVIFSWNLPSTRPGSHWVLRPWPHRAFGQPDRG